MERFQVKIAKKHAVIDAIRDKPAGQLVRFAEGEPFPHKIVGHFCRRGKIIPQFLFHVILLELGMDQKVSGHEEALSRGIHRIEHRIFVFLHVSIVCEGKALHDGQKVHQVAVHPSRFTPDQFGHVGILLLRHDAASRRVRVADLHIGKLLRRPEDDLLGQPAQMGHQQAACTRKFENIVAVADCIDAVLHNSVEMELAGNFVPIDGERRTREGRCTKGRLVEPFVAVVHTIQISLEHRNVCQQMM